MNQQTLLNKEKILKNVNKDTIRNNFTKIDTSANISWSEYRKQKVELSKQWKQQKLLKKLNKLQKRSESQAVDENITIESSKFRDYTVSIAVPGSILDNGQTPELKAYLAGQIARAAVVFNVHEVIVYSEAALESMEGADEKLRLRRKQGCIQLVQILQYLECPQYLRRYYFPIHKHLEYAGLVNPLDAPHHLRVTDECKYREGIVLNKPVRDGKGSFVYIGFEKPALIDKVLETHVRVTVKLDDEQTSKKHYKGKAVAPSAPYKSDGLYWGYSVRLAKGLNAVFSESPFKGGYDLTVGTSDKGHRYDTVQLPKFRHLLLVFGGIKGLEGCLEADESIVAEEPSELFNYYLNTCPSQGSRTIRTEEAILITLAALRPEITRLQNLESGVGINE